MPKKVRITYNDIAKALGVSKMTVSYALRNDPRISEAMRIRVQQKAEEMGYEPDPMLSALASYRHTNKEKKPTAVLAWLNFHRQPERQREWEVFNRYWKGAEDAARKLGYHLEEFKSSEFSLDRMHSIFKARGIRGILLSPTPAADEPSAEELKTFPWKDYSVVRFGESLRALPVNFVSSAQVSNTILAFEQIRKKGYERIGFAGHYLRHRLFSAGYLWAQQAMPKSKQLAPLFLPDEKNFQPLELLEAWMEKQKPDAIICSAPNILQSLEKLGYRIPTDVALASMSTFDNPINAGIDQTPAAIGRTAIEALTSQLNENTHGIPPTPKEILVEGHWVDGSMLPTKT